LTKGLIVEQDHERKAGYYCGDNETPFRLEPHHDSASTSRLWSLVETGPPRFA
jgi:hypothetical protein